MAATMTHPTWRLVSLETAATGRRHVALAAEDAKGRMAVARLDGPSGGDARVELSLKVGPVRPPVEIVGELVRSIATLAADSGAELLAVDLDPRSRFTQDVLTASGLDWRVRRTGAAACAEVTLTDTTVPSRSQEACSTSVVRAHPKGVTVLPSAEGPSLRSDPRWNARRAQRSERLLRSLITRGRPGGRGGGAGRRRFRGAGP
jgi:hypothetical protein